MSKFRFLLAFLLLIGQISVFAQTTEEEKLKEKEQQEIAFLENIVNDAKNLRLPENRALVNAKVGDAIWKSDEKAARKLFDGAINELLTAQSEAASEKRPQRRNLNLIYGQSPRWDILFLIANHDAEFALEMQNKTRPDALPISLAGFAQTQIYSGVYQAVKTEMQNEQRLVTLAADQNPERAAKLFRESIKKQISYESLSLLNKIYQKDAELGTKLAEELAEEFLSHDLTKNYDEMNVLSNFLSQFAVERSATDKTLKISENLVRNLASKMLDVWLNPETTSSYGYSNASIIEKYFPDRFAQVKKKFNQTNSPTQTRENERYNKLMESGTSPEELENQAANFPANLRTQIYYQAAERFAQKGSIAQAEKIIKDIYPDQADYYVSMWQQNLANKAVSEGKFNEARTIISQIPNAEAQINALIYLASSIFQKNREENKELALSILDEARSLVTDQPETSQEMNSIMNLATNYAAIEPSRAFAIVESVVPQMDELSQALAVVAKYQQNNFRFKDGEFPIGAVNDPGVYYLTNVLRTLKQTDSARVLQITNRFSRLDVRIWIQIQLINSNSLITNWQITDLPIKSRNFRSIMK